MLFLATALGKAAPKSTHHFLPAPATHTPSYQTSCAR